MQIKRAYRTSLAVGLAFVTTGLIGLPTEASPDDCPQGFQRESPTVFKASHRNRLTGGRVRNGKVCLKTVKPTSSDCGFYNSEGVYVFAPAHLARLTSNGAKITAGKTCLGIQRPGSKVWDPISKNPADFAIRTQSYAEHRASNSYPSPYRTISNTTETGCRGQCQIRARCKEYDYNSKSRLCRLWTHAGGRPIYDPDMKAGLKSPKSNIQQPQPKAAKQFYVRASSASQGSTPIKTFNVSGFEMCARECIKLKPTSTHGRCVAAAVAPQNNMTMCRLYQGGNRRSLSLPYAQRNKFLYGDRKTKAYDN